MHTHQRYEKTTGDKSTSGGMVTSGESFKHNYHQATSADVDIPEAQFNVNYVFGMRDKTIYIYNNKGVQATVPMKNFLNFNQKNET